ncbi:TonB C-terminal domain-containing protein [Methylobacterium organophilum]|uniref:TonB C-terminal domain-containing protein n=1 Tax=Methylobacterium organophilum TaxID=410 RepID=UPI001F134D27|nr:TonB C-terminal domain-containing protein [Methylobacterium organophilum]UMY17981.1 TonB C-terminal domain-containing protein [Methylobacterium organophilum]
MLLARAGRRLPVVLAVWAMLAPAQAQKADPVRTWVSGVVSRVGALPAPAKTVTVRVRIGAEGAVEGVELLEGSDPDGRLRKAIAETGPYPPPPARILTLEGFTELSFSLGPAAPRKGPGR